MLAEKKQHLWKELLDQASVQELTWMSGYLSGLLYHSSFEPLAKSEEKNKVVKITIAYGTETGNAKNLATKLATYSKKSGVITKLVSLEQYKPTDLSKEEALFIVISTQGDGEPPAGAQKFYEYLHTPTLSLPNLSYAVLALGDSSYPQFCKTGEDIDLQLKGAGAIPFYPLLKCDTDYEMPATEWFENALQFIDSQDSKSKSAHRIAPVSSRKQYYQGLVTSSINLNDRGSSKETYHIEIVTDASFEPGDSISVLPPNKEVFVQQILNLTSTDGNGIMNYQQESQTVYSLLKDRLNITYLPIRVVKKYAALVEQEIPETAMSLLDLLQIYPIATNMSLEEVIKILEPNPPRLYSISSSPSAHAGEIHVTVSRHTFEINDSIKTGLCSDYLSTFEVGRSIVFSIHPNHQFRLPEAEKDIIMIGPGTGIAPFRSYLAERDATGATGRNWLFFGDQHFVTDFLYQTELQSWHETGVLSRINVAFSRDQQEKIYVQHSILKNGKAFYEWLESGASVYICGSKIPMSMDVEATIAEVIMTYGQRTNEAAILYLDALKENGRYHKDVY